MPTGYTANIKDGITFETYAMNCARAFGACISLREESGGGEMIPEQFSPSDYHAKAAQKSRDELQTLLTMTRQELDLEASKAWEDAEARRLARLESSRQQRKAYDEMLGKVDAWNPPTAEHVGLKNFMREQIEQSIQWDCDEEFDSNQTTRMTGEQWAEERTTHLNRDIKYHDRNHIEEVKRVEGRTAWVKALRSALAT